MVSLSIRRTWKAIGGALVLTAFVSPSVGLSQRAAGADQQLQIEIRDRERQVLESIELERTQHGAQPELEDLASDERRQIIDKLHEEIQAVEAQGGRNSVDLIDPLAALSSLYENSGDHVLAAAANQRGLQLARVNYGLHSLEQVRFMRQSILSAEARGDVATTWKLEQELLALAQRNRDDPRTAAILRDSADKRMDVLRRYTAGELPPEIILGCYYYDATDVVAIDKEPNCTSGSRDDVKRRLLTEAQSYYAQSVNVLLENEQYESDELPILLMDLVRTSYAYNPRRLENQPTAVNDKDFGPDLGERSLRYLLAYQTTNSEPWLTRIDTLVQIADWELVHSRSGNSSEEALAKYRKAYDLLNEHGIAQASIAQFFSPTTPVVLPVFLPNPLASDETQAMGYVDISFEVTNYGRARKVEILGRTNSATPVQERRLVELILRSRFRPRVIDGQFVDTSMITMRYHLNE